MKETFVKPAVSAIIQREEKEEIFVLVQIRQKYPDDGTNGLLEIAGGKIREYENVFEALKREVEEETGLYITQIYGREHSVEEQEGEVKTITIEPFCVTQNLNGIYSLLQLTFLCRANGEPRMQTEESVDIHWMKLKELEEILNQNPEGIFPMDVLPLKKFVKYCKEQTKN